MTKLVLNREQVRAVDRIAMEQYKMPGIVLMENAGRGTAELLLQQRSSGKVLILCGKGNNGGDGFVIARHVENAGRQVHVLLLAKPEELTPDAATNFQIIEKMGIRIDVMSLPDDQVRCKNLFANTDWIVDALFGTGLQSGVREPYASTIRHLNAAGKRVLAVDVPSGLDCDLGPTPDATVKADLTATFVALKPGLLSPLSAEFAGTTHVIDIGVPQKILTEIPI